MNEIVVRHDKTSFGRVLNEIMHYYSVHEWIIRDGQPKVWMLHVHEYDLFERIWS